MPPRLQGQVILNTRPAHQQGLLTALLEHDGARVLSFPVIEIVAGPPIGAERMSAAEAPSNANVGEPGVREK